jgi:hypothetical protein
MMVVLLTFLYSISEEIDHGPAFAEFFALTWLGSIVVTVNIKLLGGTISFFQSACVIGYCLFPLAVSLAVSKAFLMLFDGQSMFVFIVRSITVLISLLWSSYSSMQFLGHSTVSKRKALAAYPMFLFYFVIAWMVLSDTD